MVLMMQPGRKDIIPVKGKIPGQLVHSTGANVSVMVLQGCKPSPQKSRPLEFGHTRGAVWIAIEYSYKLGQKMNSNFCANYAHFPKSGHVLPIIAMWLKPLRFK